MTGFRGLAGKARRILPKRGGETLVESLISLLILTMLMAGVASMLSVSLRITNRSNELAALRQEAANSAALGISDADGYEKSTVNITLKDAAAGVEVTVKPEVYDYDGAE